MKRAFFVLLLLVALLLSACSGNDTRTDRLQPQRPTQTEPLQTEETTIVTTQPDPGFGMAVISVNEFMNVRSGPGTEHTLIREIDAGSRVEILEIVYRDDVPWGRFEEGWLCMDYVTLESPQRFPVMETGSWKAITLDSPTSAHAAPGNQYPAGGTFSRHEMLTVTGVSGPWYQTEKGWVHRDSCYLYGTTTDSAGSGTIGSSDVNLRSDPDTGSRIIRSLRKGEEVEILFQVTIGDTEWGCTKEGWVCMDYVSGLVNTAILGSWYCLDPENYVIYTYSFDADTGWTKSTLVYNLMNDSFTTYDALSGSGFTYDGETLHAERYPYGATIKNGELILRDGSTERTFVKGTAEVARNTLIKKLTDTSIVGSWYRVTRRVDNRDVFTIRHYQFSKDRQLTYAVYEYNTTSGVKTATENTGSYYAFTGTTLAIQRENAYYTVDKLKNRLDLQRNGTYDVMSIFKGSLDDAVAYADSIPQQASQFAASNGATLVGSWQHFAKESTETGLYGFYSFTFHKDGTFTQVEQSRAWSYDYDTGETIELPPASLPRTLVGNYHIVGNKVELHYYGAEHDETTPYTATKTLTVEADRIILDDLTCYNIPAEQVAAKLFARE